MSERSFTEHATRNVVKNPLLSTAVTGLSLEDLTHNAVLLPVRSQDLGSSQDSIKSGPHTTPSPRTPIRAPDPQSNVTASVISDPLIANSNTITPNPQGYGQDPGQLPPGAQSKASPRNDDDFDVNEYFARLHGTRYVSAPINSPLKEDENANLDGADENLEEVNLDENRTSEDGQQSITADIAHNFSQLPQVLPHVASAVFSSFSNYLSSKSREATPDCVPKSSDSFGLQGGFDVKKPESSGYREVDFQKPGSDEFADNPPLVARKLSDAKPVGAPPCHAPPSGGSSNTFRITTKRKTYAQIPGLSTGHKTAGENIQPSNHPSSHSYVPQNFLSTDSQIISSQTRSIIPDMSRGDVIDNSHKPEIISTTVELDQLDKKFETPDSNSDNAFNVNAAFVSVSSTKEHSVPLQYSSVTTDKASVHDVDIFQPRTDVMSRSNIPGFDNNKYQTTNIPQHPTYHVGQQTLPPPPIFPAPLLTGHSKSSGANKSILPPSVARRIGSTQPVLKTSNLAPVMDANFFVPKPLIESNLDQTELDERIQKAFQEISTSNFGSLSQKISESVPKVFDSTAPACQDNAFSFSNTSLYTTQKTSVNSYNQNISAPELSKNLDQEISLTEENSSESQNVPTHTSQTAVYVSKDAAVPAPPVFFNPTVLSPNEYTFQQGQSPVTLNACQSNLNAFSAITQAQEEKPMTLSEPPKLPSGSQNFRMIQKKPQYYVGPIDNFGSTSNKTTPVIPALPTTDFQGIVFTPNIQLHAEEIQTSQQIQKADNFNLEPPIISSTNLTDYHEAKDIAFDITKPLLQDSAPTVSQELDFGTAFDLSRSTTEHFEPVNQESKGFGIIGSLKSKLSAIDINKIQDSVTTFFDPRYNDIKKDISNTCDASNPYNSQEITRDQNFDIFVPYVDQKQDPLEQEVYKRFPNINTNNQKDQYGQQYSQNSFTIGPNVTDQQSFYGSQNFTTMPYYQQDYKQVSDYNIHTSGNYNQESRIHPLSTDLQRNNLFAINIGKQEPEISEPIGKTKEVAECYIEDGKPEILTGIPKNNQILHDWSKPAHPLNTEQTHQDQTNVSFFTVDKNENTTQGDTKSIFDAACFITSKPVEKNVEGKSSTEENECTNICYSFEDKIETSNANVSSSNTYFTKNNFQVMNAFSESSTDLTLTTEVTAHVFNSDTFTGTNIETDTLSNRTAELDSENVQKCFKEVSCDRPAVDITEDSHTAIEMIHSAISTPSKEKNLSRKASVSDLNICETCREVNVQPEEKEAEDLTSQLIGNITAPIQLLNPVEVPLTETVPSADREFFDDDQYAEISHITEETIETLQGQAATEFFDREDIEDFERISNVSHQATEGSFHNYGWRSDFDELENSNSTTSKENYIFGMEQNSDNFYGGNALFFDNVSTFTNASDEIKAVLINAQEEDSSVFLPRQKNVPTAPPVEDLEDNKSDVAGRIDVHSIEQDASRDFPNFVPFPLEPSGTDDDKIESREREKPTDDLVHIDSFTDRVEKYKQFEENTDLHLSRHECFHMVKNDSTVSSPTVTLASYFDTGNYAADTHYKNSIISSPSSSTMSATKVSLSSMSNNRSFHIIDTDEFKATSHHMYNVPSAPNTSKSMSANESFGMESVEQQIQEISAELSEITKFPQLEIPKTTQNIGLNVSKGNNLCKGLTVSGTFTTPMNVDAAFREILSSKSTEKLTDTILKTPQIKSQSKNEESAVALKRTQPIQPTTSINLFTPTLTSSAEVEFAFTENNFTIDPKVSNQIVKNEGVPSSCETTSFLVVPSLDEFPSDTIDDSCSHTIKPQEMTKNILEQQGVQQSKICLTTGTAITSESSTHNFFSSSVTDPEGKGISSNEEHIKSTDTSMTPASDFRVREENTEYENRQFDLITESSTQQISSSSELFKPFTVSDEIKSHIPKDKKNNLNTNNSPFFAVATSYSSSQTGVGANAVLPDPISFFDAGTSEEQKTSTKQEESFNRLASYFLPPPKTEHSKSFFELSESQNHFRQTAKAYDNIPQTEANPSIENPNSTRSFFELSQSQNHYMDHNLTHDQYLANIQLMRDLTSTNNLDINSNDDNVVRTLNYFTVHYDNRLLNVLNVEREMKINREIEHFTSDKQSKSGNENINVDLMQTSLKSKTKIVNSIKNFDKSEINTNKDFIENFIDHNICFERCNRDDTIHNFQTTKHSAHNDNKKYEIDKLLCIINDCIHCYSEEFNVKKIAINHSDVVDDSKYSVRETMNSYNKKSNMKEVENQLGSKNNNGRKNTNVSFGEAYTDDDSEAVALANDNRSNTEYSPLIHHWYYRMDVEGKSTWKSFSAIDSRALEDAFNSPDLNENTLVPTDGGRFDVNVMGRTRKAVYWDEKPNNVRRCSWFYKGTTDAKYVPYTEAIADKLEMEYRHGMMTGEWHRRMSLPDNEAVVMHGPAVIVHFLQSSTGDAWGATAPATVRPRVVRRGHSKSEIEAGEPNQIDHLILMCHGVGSTCDIRFRPIVEVVDDFRSTSLQLIQSHYKNSYETGVVGRVEVLPISWHSTLHSGEAGVDRRLAEITLESIPRLRSFTNDTVLDVLFYASPVYSQIIIDTVCSELNRIYALFKQRNPNFKGTVSLSGHSLGSLILYDLLCHQYPLNDEKPFDSESNQPPAVAMKRYLSFAGAGHSPLKYPTLKFRCDALYALGSPIAIFECIRGVESLGEEFHLPTCDKFFNIFHPYDPIAYRIEPLINPRYKDVPPYLIPHHKGRKRMHLELKETMARVGADLRQKVVDSIKTTWTHLWKPQPPERELEKVVDEDIMEEDGLTSVKDAHQTVVNLDPAFATEPVGRLNGGRRVDRVLQEAPLEMINEYLFAMSSHVGYWESEDTMLLILREVYDALGVSPDGQVPPPTLTVERQRQVSTDDDSHNTTQGERPSTSADLS